MARPAHVAQYQRHTLQLITKILNTRPAASPFTLILDDLHQRAAPLVGEIIRRALSRSTKIIVISFESTRFHPSLHHIPASPTTSPASLLSALQAALAGTKESLVVVDSLADLLETGLDLSALFSLVAGTFASTLVGILHTDLAAVPPPPSSHASAYAPPALDLCKFLATTILIVKSFSHVLAARAAAQRSLAEPQHGLLAGAEGVVQSRGANDARGVVVEAEFRRKSGRDESEVFFLRAPREGDYGVPVKGAAFGPLKAEFVVLLAQVDEFRADVGGAGVGDGGADVESTFNLGLTEKQKAAREGVVLPYFDAQKGEGAGEGGRILYDMGEEDDFDEEEDEI
jgi:elongator complex protein 5